jgi:hypothetical protein
MSKYVKPRKKRKPMTPEQKAAAAERLAKARAARQAANPAQNKGISPEVLALDDSDTFSLKNVRSWIKTQTELKSEYSKKLRQLKISKASDKEINKVNAQLSNAEAYIRNINRYIRDGVYIDMFYGEYGETKIKYRCVHPSYDKNGNPTRTYGVFYQDLGYVYGQEPEYD